MDGRALPSRPLLPTFCVLLLLYFSPTRLCREFLSSFQLRILVVVSSSGESPCFFAFPSRYFGSLVLRIFASTLLVLTSFLADFGHLWLSALFLAAGSCCWAFLSACKPSLCCWVPLSLSFRLVCLSLFALAFALALLCAFCCLLLCASPFLCASFFVGPCPCSALGPLPQLSSDLPRRASALEREGRMEWPCASTCARAGGTSVPPRASGGAQARQRYYPTSCRIATLYRRVRCHCSLAHRG